MISIKKEMDKLEAEAIRKLAESIVKIGEEVKNYYGPYSCQDSGCGVCDHCRNRDIQNGRGGY